MEPLKVFPLQELPERAAELNRDARAGRLSLITEGGNPSILAIPFDERLLAQGIHRALSLHLFETGQVTLAQASQLAGLSLESYLELLKEAGVPAVSYPPEELEGELRGLAAGYRLSAGLEAEALSLAGE